MKQWLVPLVSAAGLLGVTDLRADSLLEQLKSEQPATLVAAARTDGNPVDGAILFSKKELQCSSCHATGGTDLLAPDLTVMANDVTDEALVEALLDPSAKIRKGFEQRKILTVDGSILIGHVVEENEQQTVLRVPNEPHKRIVIKASEMELNQPSDKSAMPDNLMDQLKDRQQFLHLLRYLIQLRELSGERNPVVKVDARRTLSPALHGQVLIENFQCNACHQEMRRETGFPPRVAPDLAWAGGRLNPAFVQRLIEDPVAAHPGTSMPGMLGGVAEAQRSLVASELTHFIMSLRDVSFETQTIDAQASQRGRELYETVGCLACHSRQNDDGTEQVLADSVPLSQVVEKYNLVGLTDFLEDPHAVRPASGMPNMRLTHWEAIDVASYLLRHSKLARTEPIPTVQAGVENGRRHFEQYGCARCHQKQLGSNASSTLRAVNFESKSGCLSAAAGQWPTYQLGASEKSAIRAAVELEKTEFHTQQKLDVTLARFNCIACHERDNWGGVSSERDSFFHTENPNIGPQGRVPPALSNVGAKLQAKWMREVLVSGRSIRPYMKTRMPQFGAQNVGHLVDLFQDTDRLPPVEHPEFDDLKEMRTLGFEMVSNGGLNCIACHTYQLQPSETMSAVDLTEMSERLKHEWFVHYLLDPQRLSPQTVMPTYWPGGKSMRSEILGGDTSLQVEALWQYLLDGRQAREPKGLVHERIELLASDEAVMLRRSWPSVGKRGIGVGYPRQVNLVFDAEQMRLAMLWAGRFADPVGVWRSQGHGVARPLEREQFPFASGPDLDDASKPWIVDDNRPPHHHFQGYDLDKLRRPVFRYRFENVDVSDYFVDGSDAESGEMSLRRTTSFKTAVPRSGLSLRIASGNDLVALEDGSYRIEKKLHVRILSDHRASLAEASQVTELRIELDVPQGDSQVKVQYSWIGTER